MEFDYIKLKMKSKTILKIYRQMKKTLTILSVVLLAFVLNSCVESSKKYQQLLAEKEALAVENQTIEDDYNAALGIINDVENNINAINDAESLMMIEDEGASQRDHINSELIHIKEVMAINRARLDSLTNVLDKANRDRGYLRNTIKKLQAQIKEKEEMIALMQEQIEQKDKQITSLNTAVNNLNENLNDMSVKNDEQRQLIANQIEQMNTVYYIAAKKKELKRMGILTSKYILRNEVPTSLFTKADKSKLNEITIEAKKIIVLSSHPAGSYTIVKNDAQILLQIINPEQFWSITKYLVIITK